MEIVLLKWLTYVDVPDTLADVVGTGAGANFGSITSDDLVPGVDLESPYTLGEESGGHEVEETGRDDEEVLEACHVTTSASKI